MITTIYVVLCAGILSKLALNVIKLRRKHKVGVGNGDIKELEAAIASHSNSSQYIPISLILLLLLELNGASFWFINIFGLALVIGRIFHAYGMVNKFPARILGMQITFYNMIAMGIANLIILAVM